MLCACLGVFTEQGCAGPSRPLLRSPPLSCSRPLDTGRGWPCGLRSRGAPSVGAVTQHVAVGCGAGGVRGEHVPTCLRGQRQGPWPVRMRRASGPRGQARPGPARVTHAALGHRLRRSCGSRIRSPRPMPQAVLGALKQPLSRLVALSPPPVGLSAGPGPWSRGPATLPPAGSGAQQTATEAPRGQRPGATVRRRAGGRCRSPRGPPAGSTSTSVCTSSESLGQPGLLGSAHPVAPRPPLLLTPASLTAVCRPRPPRGSPSFPRAQTRARPRARGARRPPRWPSPPAGP